MGMAKMGKVGVSELPTEIPITEQPFKIILKYRKYVEVCNK